MNSPSLLFICRKGRISGPYTEAQFKKLSASGELNGVTWVWPGTGEVWKRYSPSESVQVDITQFQEESHLWDRIQVVCHNSKALVSVRLKAVEKDGCTLVQAHPGRNLQPFRKGGGLILNLFDPESRMSENVHGRLIDAKKGETISIYKVKWSEVPQLLKK